MTEPKISAPRRDSAGRSAADAVHPFVRVSAEWAWRLLVMFIALLAVVTVVQRLATVVIPLAIALLAAALLAPLVDWIQRLGVPRSVGVFVALVGSLGLVAGIMTFVIEQFVAGVPQLSDEITHSIKEIQDWMTNGPWQLSNEQIQNAGDTIVTTIRSNQDSLTSGALTTATAIGHILTGTFLTLFILIFFLYGGDQIWHFVTRIVPTPQRERVRTAGQLGFGTLVGFVRATVVVAAVDAIGIGAGLAILGVPLALPLASLVFISAFIPIIGAFLAGTVAVFIALVTKGLVTALIVLGIIIAVMQLEGHVLQPLLLGRAVSIHPLAVVLAITAGIVLGGIAGGLLAVPFVAVLNTAIRSLLADSPQEVFQELQTAKPGRMYDAEPDKPDPNRFDPEATLVSAVVHDDAGAAWGSMASAGDKSERGTAGAEKWGGGMLSDEPLGGASHGGGAMSDESTGSTLGGPVPGGDVLGVEGPSRGIPAEGTSAKDGGATTREKPGAESLGGDKPGKESSAGGEPSSRDALIEKTSGGEPSTGGMLDEGEPGDGGANGEESPVDKSGRRTMGGDMSVGDKSDDVAPEA